SVGVLKRLKVRLKRIVGLLVIQACCAYVYASPTEDLAAQIERLSQAARGKVGVSAVLLESREEVTFHGSQRVPMQSDYKLPSAMGVLKRVDQGSLALDQQVHIGKNDLVAERIHSPLRDRFREGMTLTLEDLLRLMVAESDGTACDVLLAALGGPQAVTR